MKMRMGAVKATLGSLGRGESLEGKMVDGFWASPCVLVGVTTIPSTALRRRGDMTVYRASSPGSHCEIFEIPESPQEVRGIPSSSFEMPLPEPARATNKSK